MDAVWIEIIKTGCSAVLQMYWTLLHHNNHLPPPNYCSSQPSGSGWLPALHDVDSIEPGPTVSRLWEAVSASDTVPHAFLFFSSHADVARSPAHGPGLPAALRALSNARVGWRACFSGVSNAPSSHGSKPLRTRAVQEDGRSRGPSSRGRGSGAGGRT